MTTGNGGVVFMTMVVVEDADDAAFQRDLERIMIGIIGLAGGGVKAFLCFLLIVMSE